jgi:curli biogenesis system outer membrane secretion channel CsgG
MTSSLTARLALVTTIALALTGCSTAPSMGGGGTVATGGASGQTADGANPQLERCNETLGTIAVDEDQRSAWFQTLSSMKLGSTTPVLRLMIQQSNCFVVVERGTAMNNVMRERQLERSGEIRQGSNMGPGQMVAADYTMSPSITFSQRGTQGGNIGIGGQLGRVITGVGVGVRANEASTALLMIDNRSSVQIAASQGSARNFDFSGSAGILGGRLGTAGGGYSNSPEGRMIVAAFMDSYNSLVRSTRNYVAQNVKGGLGTGGRLGVQGGSTPNSPR